MDKEIKNYNIKSNIKIATKNIEETNVKLKPSQNNVKAYIKKEFLLKGLG